MSSYRYTAFTNVVALLAEGVDRNLKNVPTQPSALVALLAEGVDRNILEDRPEGIFSVALLAEGVDRNCSGSYSRAKVTPSPSSRRAWIEITLKCSFSTRAPVALLAEGVDRNFKPPLPRSMTKDVALLAEGVDRNTEERELSTSCTGRPPRGGRG